MNTTISRLQQEFNEDSLDWTSIRESHDISNITSFRSNKKITNVCYNILKVVIYNIYKITV